MALSDERERKSTIKRQEYATEMKYKALGIAWKNLQRSSEELRNYMNENPPVTEARLRYTKWMTSYEAFILANDQYCNTLNEDALQDHDNDWFCEKTVYAENRKSEAEKWFLSKEVVQPVARKAKTSKSRSSMGSVARRQEELKRLEELKKQSRILKEKQESEKKVKLLEIELEQEKERNALDKEMARSEARQEMLEELEAEEISLSQDLEEEEASSLSGPSSGDDQSSVKQTARIPSVAVSPKVNKVKQPAAKKPEKRVNDAIVEMRKPKLEIKKFNGNCMDFNKFMRQFKTRIESGCTNDDRMAYLEQFTTGEAQQIVIGYSYLEAEVGYPAAMKELKRRYGDPEVIANSYIKKLLSWAPIKANDPKALDEFSVFLMECKAATLCVGSLGVLEFSENIRMTMEKLPQYLHDRWRNVVEVHRNQQRPIRFSDIVDFTQKEAKKLNDPVYGKTPVSRETTELQKNKRSNTTFSVQSSDTAKPKMSCHYCQEQHWLSRCPGFKAKSVDGRRKFVREKKLCWNCFNKGHFASSCPKPSFCKMCAEKHSSFLHPVSPPKGEHTTTQPAENQKAAPPETQAHSLPATSTSLAVAGSYQRIGLSVVPVQVKAEGGKSIISTYAFLDNGSNITFCTEALAQKLGVKGKGVDLNLMTMDGQSVTKSTTISLEVANLYGSSQVKIPRVYTRQSIPVSTNTIASQAEVDRWPHLQGIYIPSITAEIELLIGQDVPEVHQPYEVRAMQNGGPYATRTLFGWVVNGPLSSWQENKTCGFVGNLDEQFRKFCSIEFNDLESDQVTMSQSDIQALTSMEESVTYKDGHYHVAMPWKASPSTLPNNRVLAERRLKTLQARLERSNDTHSKYTEFMETLVDKGYSRKVSEVIDGSIPKWYLPHHPVLHPQKPGKLRVVFDCSAKFHGVCLNDKLNQGPDLTNSLVGVLMRFRSSPVAFCADIEKMFYQVKVKEQDSDFLRYLWWEMGDLKKAPQEYQMLVHLFGGRSSPSCANFALKKTIKDHGKDYDPIITQIADRHFYVDDLLYATDDEQCAIDIAIQVKQLLARGGFNLTKWVSNSRKLVSTLRDKGDSNSVSLCGGNQQRALGVRWFVSEDSLGYTISPTTKPATRRGILSVVSSVFDPLGLVSPFILKAKLLMQELCRLGYDWDSTISIEYETRWQQWLFDLKKLETIRIRRCYKSAEFGTVVRRELHSFGDASSTSYGAASYLYQKDESGNVNRTLVAAKSRLAPLKAQTIPRLELQAALLAARLDTMIREELKEIKIDQSVCWTDSTCVLRYLSNDETRFKTYVGNRVSAILSRTNKDQWRFLNSAENPADLASRGMTAEEMMTSEMWYCGPKFLTQNDSKWPEMPDDLALRMNDPEVKGVTALVVAEINTTLDEITSQFSSWKTLSRVTGWVLRFTNNLKNVKHKKTTVQKRTSNQVVEPLSVDELKEAELVLIRRAQKRSYPEEFRSLETGKTIKSTSPLIRLDPKLENGVLKVGGRLSMADVSGDLKHQIILPRSSDLTILILRHYHNCTGHSGVNHVLSELRQIYWPVGGRTMIKGISRKCVQCRRRNAPTAHQKMADLPAERVTPAHPPFTFVGIDCFGPFKVKNARSVLKRYGVIFTCLSIRAVHLEVASSLDTNSFLNAYRRFVARRGVPKHIRSDNGGNFIMGQKELRSAINDWNQGQIHQYLSQNHVEWKFNPPAASHQGGVWERCIRTVRKVLSSLMEEQTINDETLQMLFCEVETIVNGRPITKVSDDPKDNEALTPNHLLLLRAGPSLPPGRFVADDCYVRRRWRQTQYLADVFWRRWLREYLPALQERQKWCKKQQNVAIGDIVLVHDPSVPRCSWPLAQVIEVLQNDSDGMVRSVRLKTSVGTLVRPITKIILLEVNGND
ncbi:uncharacterized protein [Antedon mediterranea]|uniref:uncharacterized protein n=1 Tax=Antedon mediterranea TaxID=105859 RepID=UPI003AF42CAD